MNKRKFKHGQTVDVKNSKGDKTLCEIRGYAGFNLWYVKILPAGPVLEAEEANITQAHGVSVEQLTKRG